MEGKNYRGRSVKQTGGGARLLIVVCGTEEIGTGPELLPTTKEEVLKRPNNLKHQIINKLE